MERRWYLLCYDVHDPRRLRRMAKHMEGYGARVQHSVFRCHLTPTQMQQMRAEATAFLKVEDDVLIIPICDRCAAGICTTHSAARRADWPEEPTRYTIL